MMEGACMTVSSPVEQIAGAAAQLRASIARVIVGKDDVIDLVLEAMEERQVTIDGDTLPLPAPFIVLATQNPIELEGTFPLPEAELDRFLLKVSLGYPSEEEERAILSRFETDNPLDDLQPVVDA